MTNHLRTFTAYQRTIPINIPNYHINNNNIDQSLVNNQVNNKIFSNL